MIFSRFPFLQKHLYFFVHAKGLLMRGFARKYYGQLGEDIVLGHLFSSKRKGFYIDVGAYHPMHYSNTYLLYKKGWSGINIDPNPSSIFLFNIHRRRDINLNFGISEEAAAKPYFIFNHQSCNTFSPEQKEAMQKKSFIRLIKEIMVSCFPLQKILDEYALKKEIDLLNIDAEGMSMEILRSLDWKRTHPKVICIEDDDFDFLKKENFGSAVFQFLSEHSYTLYAKIGFTCIYRLENA